MIKPNYKDGSILNLISSIGNALGYKSKYPHLKLLNPLELKKSKNIVLMLIDGLGYHFIKAQGKDSIFNLYIRGKITSVFPSSTSAAIPTIMTGLSPQEHGMTGWYMFIKELGSSIIPLPFKQRLKDSPPLDKIIKINKLFNIQPLVNKIKSKAYIVQNKKIINSGFTLTGSGKSKKIPYNTLTNYFTTIKKTIYSSNKKKYIFAYYPEHDSLCHKKGMTSREVINHFKKLNKKLSLFIKSIKGTNTTLIITADHGLINTPENKIINLNNHPKLRETLSIPLCGEHRFTYCYLKPSKEQQFKNYIKTKLSSYFNLYKSRDLFNKNYFGFFAPHKNFLDRIGDYILIAKEDYTIYDPLIYQTKDHYHKADHGGLSKEEMHVPLIIINC